jgi:myo-inositol 2-dehydrogenase/D-chiro-inositol 1-dehydrogenase
MAETLNIGIIGAGRIGKLHTENLVKHPRVNIKALSDIQADHMRDWATQLGIGDVTADYASVIQDPDINAVFICASTDTHIRMIHEAASAGKHIFCEKPISFDVHETKEALDIVDRCGVKFQTGFNRRFDANFSRVREIIAEGKIGKPHILKITSRDPNPPSLDYIKVSGGLFIDMAIHDFDMARYLAGSDVEEVYAQGAVLVDEAIGAAGDIDTAVTTLTFKNGAIGVIDNSRKAVYGYDQRVEVFGSSGSVTVQNEFPNSAEISTNDGIYRDKPKYFFLERYQQAYVREIEAFIDCIINGTAVPVDGNDGLQAELIAHAAKKSLQEKRPVKISEII